MDMSILNSLVNDTRCRTYIKKVSGRTLVCMVIIKQATITVTPCCIAGVMIPFLFCIRDFRILDVVCLIIFGVGRT